MLPGIRFAILRNMQSTVHVISISKFFFTVPAAIFAFALAAKCTFSSSLSVAINSFLQLQCNSALCQRHVCERSREVRMLRVALFVIFDGILKKLDRLVEATFAASQASVERLNVAEGHVVIGSAQRIFRRSGHSQRFFPLALL